jgi:hypothetical protein
VTLTLAPALEERIVDWLLERQDVETFTGYTTFAHGATGRDLSVAEQVSGRRRRVEIRVELQAQALDDWLAELSEAFGGADVSYFVAPILRSGHLHRPAS